MENPTLEMHWLQRTELLVGKKHLETLKNMHVLVVGLGGVGSYAAEFLARVGIGKMTIVDGDVVDLTNTNRQLQAMHSTVGMSKANLMAERIRSINPEIQLTVKEIFLNPDDAENLVTKEYNWVLDCIDSVQPKQYLLVTCKRLGVKVISSMGAGGRIDPTKIQIDDISKCFNCPFGQNIRKGLRRKGVFRGIPVVFSYELVKRETCYVTDGNRFKKSFYGTISYIPALFGLFMASHVIRSVVEKGYKAKP
jgi:tRNA A37 threonylcarbamoyladenosine dehydratase